MSYQKRRKTASTISRSPMANAREKGSSISSLTPSEELWADGIITEVEKNLDNIGYLDPVTISLQVIIENDGYSIVDDDLVRMDELVISY